MSTQRSGEHKGVLDTIKGKLGFSSEQDVQKEAHTYVKEQVESHGAPQTPGREGEMIKVSNVGCEERHIYGDVCMIDGGVVPVRERWRGTVMRSSFPKGCRSIDLQGGWRPPPTPLLLLRFFHSPFINANLA